MEDRLRLEQAQHPMMMMMCLFIQIISLSNVALYYNGTVCSGVTVGLPVDLLLLGDLLEADHLCLHAIAIHLDTHRRSQILEREKEKRIVIFIQTLVTNTFLEYLNGTA